MKASRSVFICRDLYCNLAAAAYVVLLLISYIINKHCSHHTWSSFEGAAESYNEGVRESLTGSLLLNYTKRFFTMCPLRNGKYSYVEVHAHNQYYYMCILVNTASINCDESTDMNMITHELHRKSVAEAFWNAEIEDELREIGQIGYIFSSVDSREKLMDSIDEERAKRPYAHNDCTDECKKRGESADQDHIDIQLLLTS